MGPIGFQVAFFAVFLTCANPGVGQERPDKVYVPDLTGDISPKLGAVLASEVSSALMGQGIQAFTFSNLNDQLREEQYKEVLKCDDDSSCVNEIVAGFGVAVRLFGVVTQLEETECHMELSLVRRGVLERKLTHTSTCASAALKDTGKMLAEALLNRAEASVRAELGEQEPGVEPTAEPLVLTARGKDATQTQEWTWLGGLFLAEGVISHDDSWYRTNAGVRLAVRLSYAWFGWQLLSAGVSVESPHVVTLATGPVLQIGNWHIRGAVAALMVEDLALWGLRPGVGYSWRFSGRWSFVAELDSTMVWGQSFLAPLEALLGVHHVF